jgi:hypothetical protein
MPPSAWKYLILAAIVAAGGIEIGLRLIFGLGHPLLFQPDQDAGYIPKPSQRLHRFFAHININSLGMRADEVAAKDGRYRIFFLGDSVAFGTTYVGQSEIFVTRISDTLGRDHPVSVLNAAAGGWAVANEVGYLRSRGIFQADHVVMVLNSQDLVQQFAPYAEKTSGPTGNPASAITELFFRYLLPRIVPSKRHRDSGSYTPGNPKIETDQPKVLALLGEAKKIATDGGARFSLILSPSNGRDVQAHQERWNKAIANLKAWASENSVDLLDMGPIYAKYDPQKVYFDGIHLRPFGGDLLADAFCEIEQSALRRWAVIFLRTRPRDLG